MRDDLRIEEREMRSRWFRFQVATATLAGLIGLGFVFGAGYYLGRRAGKNQAEISLQGAELQDPLARLDAEQVAHDRLTFYTQLTKAAAAPPPSSPRPEDSRAPSKTKPPPTPVAAPQPAMPLVPVASVAPEKPVPAAHEPTQIMGALAAGPARRGDFTVQVSSFQTQAEAKAYSASLERQGFRPFVVHASLPNKGTWYRVRLGRFNDEQSARIAKNILARADIPGWILRSE